MKQVRWFDMANGKLIVRKFNGKFENETETTVTFMYGKRLVTLNKGECFIYE